MEEYRDIRKDCEKTFNSLDTKLASIEKLLRGNGTVGVAEMARRAFEHCQYLKSSKNGLLDWAFRVVILTLISFIAVKLGLK
jgi:hypothetical protein